MDLQNVLLGVDEMDVIEFGRRLRTVRQLRGYTQHQLENKLGLGRDSISKIERGVSMPDSKKLYKIGKELHVSVDFLLGLKN